MEYCRQLVIDTIIEGRDLSPGQLQMIVAVLRGKTRGLGALYTGTIIEFEMSNNILGYRPKNGKGRPPGITIDHKHTCIALAKYFQYLRIEEGVSAEAAYQMVSDKSEELMSCNLGYETVKTYITDGNKYIEQETERIKSIFGLCAKTPNH